MRNYFDTLCFSNIQLFFFGRSRGSQAMPPYIPEDEVKSCCGFMVTESVSIRWFIIMIAFVGFCCTIVGTVLGAVQTHSSEYITVTLILIGEFLSLIYLLPHHPLSRNIFLRDGLFSFSWVGLKSSQIQF